MIRDILALLLLLCSVSQQSIGQNVLSEGLGNLQDMDKDWRYQIRIIEDYCNSIPELKGTGCKPVMRSIEQLKVSAGRDTSLKNFSYQMEEELKKLKSDPAFQKQLSGTHHGNWQFKGGTSHANPNPVWPNGGFGGGVGRLNCIKVDPTDTNRIYVGSAQGGLWRSEDYGVSWENLTDGMWSSSVSGIVLHPTDPEVIYILNGDGDGRSMFSTGVYKTTNGGLTWVSTGLQFGLDQIEYGYDLEMDPFNPSHLIATTNRNYYSTWDGGATWVAGPIDNKNVFQIVFDPIVQDRVYFARRDLLLISTSGGLSLDLQYSMQGSDRIALAVNENPFRLGFVALSDTQGMINVGYSTDPLNSIHNFSGFTYNIGNHLIDGSGLTTQASYDLCLAINPQNVSHMICGAINSWSTQDQGSSWTIDTHYRIDQAQSDPEIERVHADWHNLIYSGNTLYAVNDGGVYRSYDHGDTWADISQGLGIGQIYCVSSPVLQSSRMMCSMQDLGNNLLENNDQYSQRLGADGLCSAYHPTDPDIVYMTKQRGDLYVSNDNGITNTKLDHGYNVPFMNEFILDQNNPNQLFLTARTGCVFTQDAGQSWNINLANQFESRAISDVCQDPVNPHLIYFASDSMIFRWNLNTQSTNAYVLPDSLYLTDIAVNPSNTNELWFTCGGFVEDSQVYILNVASGVFINMSNGLPAIPGLCLKFVPGTTQSEVYLGNYIGVWYRDESLNQWHPYNNGLPLCNVMSLDINSSEGIIRAGTYGRGLWESSLYGVCPSSLVLNPGNDPSNPNYTGSQNYSASGQIQSTRVITGGVGTNVTYKAADSIWLFPGFEVRTQCEFEGIITDCNPNE